MISVPKDCVWATWSPWSSCSSSCGKGFKTRSRIKSQEAEFGGNDCPGSPYSGKHCGIAKCPGKTQ